jgi:hypothetical protein
LGSGRELQGKLGSGEKEKKKRKTRSNLEGRTMSHLTTMTRGKYD